MILQGCIVQAASLGLHSQYHLLSLSEPGTIHSLPARHIKTLAWSRGTCACLGPSIRCPQVPCWVADGCSGTCSCAMGSCAESVLG